MARSLQYAFVESQGEPVLIGDWVVKQKDSIPITDERVLVRFVEGQERDHGVRLKTKGGWIELSDGQRVEVLYIWRSPDTSDSVEHCVYSPTGELDICNIYRIHHSIGAVTEDMWTGNAGMVVLSSAPSKRRYGCSAGLGEFDPSELVVEVEWSDVI